jgi:hypothetical protein
MGVVPSGYLLCQYPVQRYQSHADKAQPQVGSSYSFGELQSLLGEDARLMLPSEVASRLSNSQFTFRKWEVGIEFIKRDGLGTAHYFVPLEVLLGLRDY